MKTLYFECNMGAAGDMLMAALLEIAPDREEFVARLNALGLPGVRVSAGPSVKLGIKGTSVSVAVNGVEEESDDPAAHIHGHNHTGLNEIRRLIGGLPVSEKVKSDALAVYGLIAEAESAVHGIPVTEIHFHETGTMDAVADIIGVCLLMEELSPELVLASPVNVGCGETRCAHGVLPVPAPAAAHILRGAPVYGASIRGELCTPTGAALLRHFVSGFGDMPEMSVSKIGYGMGKKDFEALNCVRAFLGETRENPEEVAELSCSLDDMTPEAVAFAQEMLLSAGALDVYTAPIGMKKSRQGVLLTCVCRRDKSAQMAELILRHTTTLGLREKVCRRYTLRREESLVQTPYGPVRIKTAYGNGFTKQKPEYEDLAKAAKENRLSLYEVIKKAGL